MGLIEEERILTDIGFIKQTNRNLKQVDYLIGRGLTRYLDETSRKHAGGSFTVLDVPSGTRLVAATEIATAYPQATVYAVDLEHNTEPSVPNLIARQGSAFDLPIESGAINFAYTFALISWYRASDRYDRIAHFVEELGRVLAPGGRALLDLHHYEFSNQPELHKTVLEERAGARISQTSFHYPLWAQVLRTIFYFEKPGNFVVMEKPQHQIM